MAYEQKEGNGALFKNERKEKDSHPDYRGDCKLGGKDYWISAWIKKGAKGTFMSLALQPKEDAQGRRQGGKQEDNGGDVPF
jgi:hypothetical protein